MTVDKKRIKLLKHLLRRAENRSAMLLGLLNKARASAKDWKAAADCEHQDKLKIAQKYHILSTKFGPAASDSSTHHLPSPSPKRRNRVA